LPQRQRQQQQTRQPRRGDGAVCAQLSLPAGVQPRGGAMGHVGAPQRCARDDSAFNRPPHTRDGTAGAPTTALSLGSCEKHLSDACKAHGKTLA